MTRILISLIIITIIFFSGCVSESSKHDAGDESAYYTFGVKFEPPKGKIIHAMGQFASGNKAYLQMLNEEILPASSLTFFSIGSNTRSWDAMKKTIGMYLRNEFSAGRIPHLSIGFTAGIRPIKPQRNNPYFGMDDEIAETKNHDHKIRDVANMVAQYKRPVFVRIGGEFSGWWNGYHPYIYPKAFRKIVEIFREERVYNAAFIWCYEPAADNDFDEKDNSTGEYKWFPGDDVIDWYGVDVFDVEDFSGPLEHRGRITKNGKTMRFLKMALEHKKPVVIAESSAAKMDITSDVKDGIKDWNIWFAKYFSFIESNPVIKSFHYINYDWTEMKRYANQGWTQASVNINSYIKEKYIEEISKEKYLHTDQIVLLKDYETYR